ncbi:hypothetical protein BREU_1255 [Bifidobacterium reuteri DSM 23975]|uniref:Uncharacterized protein n=1 Tax=Bifidobacterium reuteri DSM 23975 TaxID=1437610 RepID=A0A087CMI0_9BIFI|nr:hypothetical protein [Bifidobacterium reuteri]KFI84480.1 hypothetical protein BREU_1255 [Bifidobacterium reuteri DSM 23975]
MSTIRITGKQPGTTNVTIASTVNPAVKTVVPVTVKSLNLLRYGPASGNGLNVTVNKDGSLDLASAQAIEVGKGVVWPALDLTAYIGKTLTLGYEGDLAGLPGVIVSLRKADGSDGTGIYQGRNNQPLTVTADNAKTLHLRIYKGGENATALNGNLKIRLTEGSAPQAWMRPDVTNISGGGFELKNLFPALDPGTKSGVTCTRDGESYTLTGTPSEWGGFAKKATLQAGDYRLTTSGADKPRVTCILPDGTQYNSPISFTLTEPTTCTLQITFSPNETYDNATVTPYLRRI